MTEWLELVEDKKPEKPDVWVSEIRVKLRGRDARRLVRLIRGRKKWRIKRADLPDTIVKTLEADLVEIVRGSIRDMRARGMRA